jgi:hypothetical protein
MIDFAMDPEDLAKHLRSLVIDPIAAHLSALERTLRVASLEELTGAERYADPRCLTRHGYRCFSQNDEDGTIDEIFRRIGTTNQFFVEFGVEGGVENNTLALLLSGWRGLWIEANPGAQAQIRLVFAEPLADERLVLEAATVTAENIESILAKANVPVEADLLSIDIDGNDYWVWRAITAWRPRAVVIEYNASLGRSACVVAPYDPEARWDGTMAFGASLGALEELGRRKGYALVGCGIRGVNAFFVRKDLVGAHFLEPFTAQVHFEPPRYGSDGAGHPPRWARFVRPEERSPPAGRRTRGRRFRLF